MKNLETLIQELCPDGVEFVKLGKVCELRAGWGFPTKEQGLKEGKYPFYKVADMNNSTMFMSSANNYISEETSRKLRCKPAPKGTIIFPKIGATMTTNKKRILTQEACYDNNVMGLIAHSINAKFLYYLLSQVELLSFTNGFGAVPSLDRKKIENYEIPLPPIEVQTEIVRILDKFTSLEAELEAELDCRKRQYEYYRDKLLSFDNVEGQEVEWKKMSEVGTFIRGNGLQKKDFTESGVGCIHYGQIYTKFNTFTDKTLTYCSENVARKLTPVHPGDLIIACTSENVEDVCKTVAWLGKEDIVTGGHACVFSHHENPKYIAYLLQTENFFQQKKKYARGVKVIDIKVADLQKITLPIPSLEEQHRIVSILDRFESLTTSLQSGLPAEIAARRQQYEHYRDKLLTFKRKGAA